MEIRVRGYAGNAARTREIGPRDIGLLLFDL
jgi:hypothetical protein